MNAVFWFLVVMVVSWIAAMESIGTGNLTGLFIAFALWGIYFYVYLRRAEKSK